MRDQWVGDIGDFGKYALLRGLCGTPEKPVNGLKLGVVWYYNPSTKNVICPVYLRQPCPLEEFCPSLYKKLNNLVFGGKRKVSQVQKAGILPVTKDNYFIERVRSGNRRKAWFKRACKATVDANVVFLDPDNGIQPQRVTEKTDLTKYILNNELTGFANQEGRQKSLVIYKHATSNGDSDLRRIWALGKELERPVWTFQWASRYFVILPSTDEKQLLRKRLASFRKSWESVEGP